MEKMIDKIDNAVKNLKSSFRAVRVSRVLEDLVLEKEINNEAIAKKVKEEFDGITRDDLIREIAKYALQVAASKENIPNSHFCKAFFKELKEKNIPKEGIVEYLKNNGLLLCYLTIEFATQRYEKNVDPKKLETVNNKEIKKYIYYLGKTNTSNVKTSPFGKIHNLLFNKTKQDIILNAQCKKKNLDYEVGDLYASMNQGKKVKQEDRVILLEHPNNKEFKLMAIADANENRGSLDSTSNYIILSLMRWFESLNPLLFEDIDYIEELLNNKLKQINMEMIDSKKGNSSLACIIIGKDKTLVSTIGNSRVYKEKEGKIEKLNKENTLLQNLIDEGYIKEEFSRFHKAFPIILNELGQDNNFLEIGNNTLVIDNDYDKISIITSGVIKGLEEDKIKELLGNKQSISNLVRIATTTSSVLEEPKYGYNREIPSGEYNATAAIYVKKKAK